MIELVPPNLAMLPAYEAELRLGWSPNNLRDVSHEHLALIGADGRSFVESLEWKPGQMITIWDGTTRERIPGPIFWIWNGVFCGQINLRYLPGTLDLPPHVLGHVGYAVVPSQRRRGVATAALRLLLPIARGLGLERVSISTQVDNKISERVIRAVGGVPAETARAEWPETERLYWVQTAR